MNSHANSTPSAAQGSEILALAPPPPRVCSPSNTLPAELFAQSFRTDLSRRTSVMWQGDRGQWFASAEKVTIILSPHCPRLHREGSRWGPGKVSGEVNAVWPGQGQVHVLYGQH